MTKKHSYFQQRILNLTLQGTGISSALHRPIRMVCKASSSLTNISADRALLFLYCMLCNPHFSQYFMCSPVRAMAKKWWEPFRMCWATPSCHSSQPSMSSLTHEGMFSVFHLVLDCTRGQSYTFKRLLCSQPATPPVSSWLTDSLWRGRGSTMLQYFTAKRMIPHLILSLFCVWRNALCAVWAFWFLLVLETKYQVKVKFKNQRFTLLLL